MTITQDLLAQNESLEQHYTLVRPAEVKAYLEQYPFLMPILQQAPTKIHAYFPAAQLYLEVYTFRDSEGEECNLFVYISPNSEPEAAVETKSRFDDAWGLDALDAAQGRLGITVEYL